MRTVSSNISHRIESLESRRLLSTSVASIVADNRGEVLITLTDDANGATINKNSVQMYTAGPDGIIGNADDTRVPASVRYTASLDRITISGTVPADATYRVKLAGARLHAADGEMLDGEFNPRGVSGNGVPGGNYEFIAARDKSDTPTVRMSTVAGVVSLKLFRDDKPLSVANFLSYANSGAYDNFFFTRSVPGFILQGGSLRVDGSAIDQNETSKPIPSEFDAAPVISNTRGTVAFARDVDDPDSATNQFFFNVADNSDNLDVQDGGFTVFAQCANASSLAVMDALASYDVVALRNEITDHGVVQHFEDTSTTDTPVIDADRLDGTVQTVDMLGTQRKVITGSFSPARDLLVVRRTAVLNRVYDMSAAASLSTPPPTTSPTSGRDRGGSTTTSPSSSTQRPTTPTPVSRG